MKKLLFFITSAVLTVIVCAAMLSFKAERPTAETHAGNTSKIEAIAPNAAPQFFTKKWSLDTIANAANDTLALGSNILSNYEWSYHITRTSISGTANIAVTVQASGLTTGNDDWVTVATTSATTATNEILSGVSFYGVRHRLIVDGTGTQSTSYKITGVLKKKY